MKLRVGAALFGLGVLLLVFAAGLPFYVAPAVTKLPYDLEPTTSVAEAKNAKFLKITASGSSVSIEVPQGDLVSNVEVIPQPDDTKDRLPKELKGDAVIWDVYQTVRRTDNQDVVSQYSTELALYRISGAAAPWKEQWLNETGADKTPVGNVSYSGQIYKFPFGTAKRDYQIFDRDLKRATAAKFVGTEKIKGVEAYRFEQRIENEVLATPESSLQTLVAKFAPGATSGEIVYSNTRTVWVDPVTGSYVNVREQQHKELRPNTGSPTVLLDADFNYTDDTVSRSVQTVKDNRFKIGLISFWGPIAAGVLGLIALVVGVWLVTRPQGGAARHRADPPAVAPVADPTPTRVDQEPVRDTDTVEQPKSQPVGGPLTDEIPPASTNWKSEDPTVPTQRPAPGEVEQR
ncbi:porin PorA family protein [Micromonospora sp. LH3U1]|uniref:porin PorA family protein n=1 Tax=Micromonospora sp. LH3U1 TaxID=3018339 RepID=UPI00234BB253|nr:porin PorA family protein [Micromonospora sp. LH3U1]WCN81360.1 porin PorA family protein [Micromonospora sp. LH3U1]